MLNFQEIWQFDWQTFMTGTGAWLSGLNPYGPPPGQTTGAMYPPYPPTALTWMAPFTLFGPLSFWLWTLLQLGGWWAIVRRDCPSNFLLVFWGPVLLHLILGQCTLGLILILWAAYRAPKRAFWWGAALAITLTKPQVALLPFVYLLWHDRRSPHFLALLVGIACGTLALALPPTLKNPQIWSWWLASFGGFKGGLLHMAAWQSWGILPLALATWFWYRRHAKSSSQSRAGWPFWSAASLFQQGSYYGVVPVIAIIRPVRNYWSILGFTLSAFIQGPANPISLPLILALHMLAAWLISGGPKPDLGEAREGLANQVV